MTSPPDAGGDTNKTAQPPASTQETWELRLYVTGRTPACVRALANLQRACAHWLPGRYHIEVIDLLENPRRAAEDQIVAVPTLVKVHPPPTRKIVGDLSNIDAQRLLFGTQLRPEPTRPTDERG
jgi:circadian clock protein KaiB